MITTSNYNSQKISLGSIQNKKSRGGKKYQNIPILYDERKALVHLCGRFQVRPQAVVVEVDDDNRKLFEDFEKKLQSEAGDEIKLIKYDRVYLKIYFSGRKMSPKFWQVFEKDGEEYKKAILGKEAFIGEDIEGEIVFSIANIFVGKNNGRDTKSIICVAKEILIREIIEEKSYFGIPVGKDSDDEEED